MEARGEGFYDKSWRMPGLEPLDREANPGPSPGVTSRETTLRLLPANALIYGSKNGGRYWT